jgi:branched-chain amino acid transport system permease protein
VSSDSPTAGRVLPAARPALPRALRLSLRHLGCLLLLLIPIWLLADQPTWLNIIAYAFLFGGLASAWNIIGGFGGQFSLGHGVFFAVGAYVGADLYVNLQVSPWLALIPAAFFGALVALFVSWPTFRLKGPFFAIATLALNEIGFVLANYFESVTGGPRGILIPFKAGLENMIFKDKMSYIFLMFGFLALCLLVAVVVRHSRLGYQLLAIRDDEDTARAAGVNVLAAKLKGIAISAALTAMGGVLFAMYVRFIDPPTLFSLPDVGVKIALIVLIGGIGTLWGPVVGALLIVPLENFLRTHLGGLWPGTHLIVLGAALVVAALFMKRGIVGAVLAVARRRR